MQQYTLMMPIKYKIEVGSGNFEKFLTNDFLLVDKTLLIKDMIEGGDEVLLITRPRRWGKTLNMRMLNYFFSIPTNGDGSINAVKHQEKIHIFEHLKIAQYPEIIKQYCGRYPTIFITFKDIKEATYEGIKDGIRDIISKLYTTHEYLLHSPRLSDFNKAIIQKYIIKTYDDAELGSSLNVLS